MTFKNRKATSAALSLAIPVAINLRFEARHIPDDGTPGLLALLQAWKMAIPASIESPVLDREDWIEMACRLESAIRICPERVALVSESGQATMLQSGDVVPIGSPAIFLGAWSRDGRERSMLHLVNMSPANLAAADRYARLATFQRFAGRRIALCGLVSAEQGAVHLYDAIASVSSNAPDGLLIKVNRGKYAPLSHVQVPGSCSREEAARCVSEQAPDLMWAGVHLEGDGDAFLVQPYIAMHAEYRIIVINHSPVAGAGCVEQHTPLDNKAPWSPMVEWVRGDGCVVDRTDIVTAYRAFAAQYTEALRVEAPECRSYTLDVAVTSDGSVCVIEMNPLRNYGLYAMDYDAILQAELTMAL